MRKFAPLVIDVLNRILYKAPQNAWWRPVEMPRCFGVGADLSRRLLMVLAPMKSTVPCAFFVSLLAAFVGTGVVCLALATGDSKPGSVGAVGHSVLLGRSLRRLKAS